MRRDCDRQQPGTLLRGGTGQLGPHADQVVVEFPVVETVEKYTDLTYQQTYTCTFRGNTLMHISPRAESPCYRQTALGEDGSRLQIYKGYPLYLRDALKGDRAPMKKMERYVAPTLI